jgi:hypothetical protein
MSHPQFSSALICLPCLALPVAAMLAIVVRACQQAAPHRDGDVVLICLPCLALRVAAMLAIAVRACQQAAPHRDGDVV